MNSKSYLKKKMKVAFILIFSLLGIFSKINCANNSLVDAHLNLLEKCFLFKYSKSSYNVINAKGFYVHYSQFVAVNVNEKNQVENIFYEFLEVFEKKSQSSTCDKVDSFCMIKSVPRKTFMNRMCYYTGKI